MEFAGDKGFYSCWRTLKRSRWRLRALRGSQTKGRLVLALKLIFVGRHPSRSGALCWPASHNPTPPRGRPSVGRPSRRVARGAGSRPVSVGRCSPADLGRPRPADPFWTPNGLRSLNTCMLAAGVRSCPTATVTRASLEVFRPRREERERGRKGDESRCRFYIL